jgi:hypothetical protein
VVGGLLAAAAVTAAAVVATRRPLPPAAWAPVVIGHRDREELVVISRDGSTLAYANADSITVEPRAGGAQRVVRCPGGAKVSGVMFSVRGDRVLAACVSGQDQTAELWALDPAGAAPVHLAPTAATPALRLNGGPMSIAQRSDGALLAVLDGEPHEPTQLALLAPDGTTRQLVQAGEHGRLAMPHWSPDGSRAVVTEFRVSDTRVLVVDIATARVHEIGQDVYLGCDWLSDRSLVCPLLRDAAYSLVEIGLSPDGEASAPRDRFALPEYDAAWGLQATASGVLFVTSSNREQLQVLDLQHPGTPRPLLTGSVTDIQPAGWTSTGALIFGASVHGRLTMMARRPDGQIEALRPAPAAAEIPLAVLGDTVIFGRFPGAERTLLSIGKVARLYPVDGELFRLSAGTTTSLGPTHAFTELRCAGDRAPPCVLTERVSETDLAAVKWDPVTGARGPVVARWSMLARGLSGLAPDGHTLVQAVSPVAESSTQLVLVDLDGGGERSLSFPGYSFRSLTWQPDGALIATGVTDSAYVIVRLREGAPPEVLHSETAHQFVEPSVRPDGHELVVPALNMAEQTLWWLPREGA